MPAPRERLDARFSTFPSSNMADWFRRSSTKTSANSPPVASARLSVLSSVAVSITTESPHEERVTDAASGYRQLNITA
jgi:hypothetical protein